jgi:exodeoxyribonuclease VII large subunit
LVIGKQEEFSEMISDFRRRMKSAIEITLEKFKRRFQNASQSYVFKEPLHLLRERQQRIDELSRRMESLFSLYMERLKSRTSDLKSRLKNLNPEAVLQRGYAIISDTMSGIVVTDPDVPEGTLLDAKFAKGVLQVKALRRK